MNDQKNCKFFINNTLKINTEIVLYNILANEYFERNYFINGQSFIFKPLRFSIIINYVKVNFHQKKVNVTFICL
ncbi:unnamed protein product (macronuclear) [Paramecium tetraurelia]|uniref:Uncharacterized protein n=1 Tax=Paramecium tetraurelia TaxID=5888 RepID=A0BRC0_PARTE|nr:uncharacterized protein GSPATT00031318001 [Paramecium tetraurelia]CAK61087.1 unnamed protein product [Paramecium tetraurelia]|eukprot:XP_001428485.1 hypothetical protein (macronuclear) [Paramecium tetraurelia strain d4-2]